MLDSDRPYSAQCQSQGHSPLDHEDPTDVTCSDHGCRFHACGHAYSCAGCEIDLAADDPSAFAVREMMIHHAALAPAQVPYLRNALGVPIADPPAPTAPEVSAFYRDLARKIAAERGQPDPFAARD